MAFDYFGDEEDKDQGNGTSQQQGQLIGSASPVVTGNNAKSDGDSKGTNSGTFTNLQQYLDKNSSLNFGQQVAGKVGESVTDAENAQKDADTQFRGQVDQNTVKQDDDVLKSVNDDPTKTDYDAFTKMRDAQYGGPKDLTDTELYQPTYQKTDTALQNTNATKTEGGRKALLDQDYGSGVGRYDYSQGQQKLDNLLIQNDPNSKAAFQGVQDRAQAASDNFGALQQQLNQYAQAGQDTTNATRGAARGTVGIDDAGNLTGQGAIGTTRQGIDSAYAQQQKTAAAHTKALQDAISSGDLSQLTPEDRAMLGFDNVDAYYGTDPSKYLTTGNFNEKQATAADQGARFAALNNLAGTQDDLSSQEGNYGEDLGKTLDSFDSKGAGTEIGAAKTQAVQNATNQAKNDTLQSIQSQTPVNFSPSFVADDAWAAKNMFGVQGVDTQISKMANGTASVQDAIDVYSKIVANPDGAKDYRNKLRLDTLLQLQAANQQKYLNNSMGTKVKTS